MNSLFEHLSSHDLTWAINVGGPSLDAVDMLAAAGAKCLFIVSGRRSASKVLDRLSEVRKVTACSRCSEVSPNNQKY